MQEITLITAFFDIGRKDFKAIPRNNDKYFSHFEFWARLENNLIVYTSESESKRILDIRKSFGLENKTKIIEIDNINLIEPSILERMKVISKSKIFTNFRFLENATSNIPEYSYLMLLKSWFLKDAVNRNLTSNTVAWIDFGFNHGGELYTNPNEFSYEWKYDFNNKIQLFYYKNLDTKPIFDIVRRLSDSIMGCLIVLPKDLCDTLWNLNKDSMISLNQVDLYDDDQLLLLMSYRAKPEIFEMHKSEWFLPLKTYGSNHLSTIEVNKKSILKVYFIDLIRKSIYVRKVIRYLIITWKSLY